MPTGPPCEVGINISILQMEKNKPPFFMARTGPDPNVGAPTHWLLPILQKSVSRIEQKENNRLLSMHYIPVLFPLTIALNMPL